MSTTMKRRDFKNRSRIDQKCSVDGQTMTTYCDIDSTPVHVEIFEQAHMDCEASR